MTILSPEDPPPVVIRQGGSPFVSVSDHAGRMLPRRLGNLGLPAEELERHIAWDIGAGAVAMQLGDALDACVIAQRYSRLVIAVTDRSVR